MTEDDYVFPETPELEAAYRRAHRALEPLLAGVSYVPEEELLFTEVLSQFDAIVNQASMAVAAELGPRIGWKAPRTEGFSLALAGIDLDALGSRDFGIRLDRGAFQGPDGSWSDSALDRAARAYRRECRWDFAPDESGVWLLVLAPTRGMGGADDGLWWYDGHLAGFAVLHDRDDDEAYESVAHVWTAKAWRRRGIATRLLREAEQRFAYKNIEGPVTESGAALIAALSLPQDHPTGEIGR
jgi:GNAT superfamily N-acetyltransferase